MLSLILPVKEEPYLPFLLNDLEYILNLMNIPHEFLVQTEKGLGYAVQCGLKRAKGNVICIMDADGSHPYDFVPTMVFNIENGYDIVIGSKYNGGNNNDSGIRTIISKVYSYIARIIFLGQLCHVKDPLSGFIVANRKVFDEIPITNNGYKFVIELLVKSQNRFRVYEQPIDFEVRKLGKSKASVREALNTIIFMFRLKTNFKN